MSKASAYFTLDGLSDKHDIKVKAIKRELDALPGVLSVSISDDSKRVAVDFDTTGVQTDCIGKRLEKMGYQIRDTKTENHVM